MIIINAAVRLYALKDVNDLSLPTLRRVAQDPSDPRSGKAKNILKRKYRIGRKTGMTRDQGKALTKHTHDTIKMDKAKSKRTQAKEKLQDLRQQYREMREDYMANKTPAKKARLVKMRMKINDLKQKHATLKTEHQQATKQATRSKRAFRDSMKSKNIPEYKKPAKPATKKEAPKKANWLSDILPRFNPTPPVDEAHRIKSLPRRSRGKGGPRLKTGMW